MFTRPCFDGKSTGDGCGGILTKGFTAWSDFQKNSAWLKKYHQFEKREIKRLGKANVYDKLKDAKIEKFKEVVAWIAEQEVLLVKRGDYKQWYVHLYSA